MLNCSRFGGLCATLLTFALAACGESTLTVGGPLFVELRADSVISVSDSLIVDYDASGRSLLGIVFDFGDSQVDSVQFVGSQSAGGRVAHLYALPGAYVVSGRVEDAVEGSITDQLTVTVTP